MTRPSTAAAIDRPAATRPSAAVAADLTPPLPSRAAAKAGAVVECTAESRLASSATLPVASCDPHRQSFGDRLWPVMLTLLLAGVLLAPRSQAVELNLAAVSCAKYENEVLTSTIPGYGADSIDTVMWLFGFATAKSGDRVMYGDSLRAFGFALDAECKDNPTTSLLEAVTGTRSKRENPMDLTRLDCTTFETRHAGVVKSDPDSAHTLTMWMFGFAVGLSGSHVLDPGLMAKFDAALAEHCLEHPNDSVFDALRAPNPAVPGKPRAKH